ncbi:MAG: hypothetical protein ACJA2Q_002277 [Pseudohongiellaceae bacterium]|jgi:hypothetical protein
MDDSMRLAIEGKTFGTKLSRCDLVIEHAEALLEYETINIPTLSPLPSELIGQFRALRIEIVLDEAQKIADKAADKSKVASTINSKYNALGQGLLKAKSILENISPGMGQSIIDKLSNKMHETKLSGFLENAEKAEFKGNAKKAIDQYQEALFFIQNDDIPDQQQHEEITKLEAKIQKLKS